MGQMRTGILNLQKLLVNNPAQIEEIATKGRNSSDRVQELGSKTNEGFDLINMHLAEKFKKEKTTIAAKADSTLKSVMDPEILGIIKGIVQWQGDIKKLIATLNKENETLIKAVSDRIALANAEVVKLQALAEKKKAKLFKSAKYKDKIKGYLAALDQIATIVKQQSSSMKKSVATFKLDDAWVDKFFKISADMTVGEISKRSSATLDNQMATYNANKKEADAYVRVWRDEYKGLAGQLATMRKWGDEADAMEAEAP